TPTQPSTPERAGNGGGTSKRASTLTPGTTSVRGIGHFPRAIWLTSGLAAREPMSYVVTQSALTANQSLLSLRAGPQVFLPPVVDAHGAARLSRPLFRRVRSRHHAHAALDPALAAALVALHH